MSLNPALEVSTPAATAAETGTGNSAVVKHSLNSNSSNSQQKLAHQVVGVFNGVKQLGQPLAPQLQPLPLPPPQQEIEEDGYVDGISKIIQRDFFPDLEKLRVQKQLFDAVDLELDSVKAAKLAFQLAKMTDAGGEEEEVDDNDQGKEYEFDTRLSLDQFQAKYTSEDNASFNQLVESENEKKRQKFAHFYPSQERLLQVTDKKLIEGISRPINTWEHTAKSALMYGPEGVPMTLADLPPSRAGPKKVIHSNTRFDPSVTSASRSASANAPPPPDIMKSMAQAAHTQQVWRNMTAATPALHATGANRVPLGGQVDDDGRIIGREPTPLINGYKLLPDTPDIRPHQDVDPSALITWGMVESTPLLVDMGKSGGPTFSMAPTPKRETLAKELGEKASMALRKKTLAATPSLDSSISVRRASSSRPHSISGGGRTPIAGATPSTLPNGVFKKPLPRHVSPALQSLKNKLAASGSLGGGNILGGGLTALYSSAKSGREYGGLGQSPANGTPSRSWTESRGVGIPVHDIPTPGLSTLTDAQQTPLHVQGSATLPVQSTRTTRPSATKTDRSKITDNLLDLN